MKKALICILLIVVPFLLFGEFGDGKTPGTAYYGTISAARNWTVAYNGGIIYVGQGSGNEDLIVDSGGILTIDPGVTVIFCRTTSDLIIQNTGQISAGGDGSIVTFTRYYPTYSYWGHISVRSTAGSSFFNNCKIEYGNVSSTSLLPADPNQYGGGIHADLTSLTITKCEFLHNTAGWGGAIFVGDGKAPSISNCYIHDNTATTSGGGIYFWKNSSATFFNSIITANNCTGSGGGGGIFLGGAAKGVKIINCTISNNNANNQSLGYNVKIYNNTATPRPQFINSIIWYPANSIVGSIYSTDFYYCAIQNPPLTTYTGYITLNASNVGLNPQGPFFNTMSGSDWSIKVVSPCRDAGTTSSPAVPTDYAGNSRIGNYDIGAYEVQYNGWKTTATTSNWNDPGNWDLGVPSSNENVVIRSGASYYPTGSISLDYTIGAGYGLVLDPGAKATFNLLTKDGDLKLMSNSNSATSSLITNNSVSAIIELYLTGGGGSAYKWHYISSPVSSLPVSTFILKTTMDFAQYFESRPTTDPLQGWVAYDGYAYFTGTYLTGPPWVISSSNLNVGQGYNYYYSSNYKFSFSGSLNVSTVSPSISFGGNVTFHGFNLLGNPFSSGLNWDDIIADPGFPSLTSKGLYFTRNNAQCSYINSIGYPDASVTGIIPPMQGFFIHTTNASATLPLVSTARSHNIPARYKGTEQITPLVRLQLDNDSLKDNTVIYFDNKATTTYDDDFDAVRMFLNETNPYIYSSDGMTKYAINGQPFPETSAEYPIVVNLTNAGIHTLIPTQLQGLDNYSVTLKDNTTGYSADLRSTPEVTFFTESTGIILGRFIIKVSDLSTGAEKIPANNKQFNIYTTNNFINIQTLGDDWDGKTGSVCIYDLAGKIFFEDPYCEFHITSLFQIQSPSSKGLLIVEIKSGVKKYVSKVIIR